MFLNKLLLGYYKQQVYQATYRVDENYDLQVNVIACIAVSTLLSIPFLYRIMQNIFSFYTVAKNTVILKYTHKLLNILNIKILKIYY